MAEAPITLDTRLRIPEHVVRRAFAEETVLLNLDSGRYHGVNGSGSEMLEALDEPATPREVAGRVARRLAQPVERVEADVVAFLAALHERGLVETDG